MLAAIYHPAFWFDHGHWGYENHTPGNAGKWRAINFRINDKAIREADFVVVHEGLDEDIENVKAKEFILVTGEEKAVRPQYNHEYLKQFDLVITTRDDITHPQVVRTFCLHPWRVRKTYDELASLACPPKTKVLSAIVSSLADQPNYKKRFDFITNMKSHYGAKLDWFSKGQNTFISDKWDGLAPYLYSVALENSQFENYFTEKINDCFLGYTMPLYHGCPNIKDFFDDRSFVSINVDDIPGSIQMIDTVLRGNLHEANFKYIAESRRLVLERYHFIAALTSQLENRKPGATKVIRTIRTETYYAGGRLGRLRKMASKAIKLATGR